MVSVYVTYGIALVAILLGFVALLMQKTYVDRETKQPTEIELPILGKMKTNAPALAFVFLGVALALAAFEKSYPPKKVEWTVQGSFKNVPGKHIDWPTGTLAIHPTDFQPAVSTAGRFTITAMIEEGRSFEDAIELIDYSHPSGSVQLRPKQEYGRYLEHDTSSLIEGTTETTRRFKPLTLTVFP